MGAVGLALSCRWISLARHLHDANVHYNFLASRSLRRLITTIVFRLLSFDLPVLFFLLRFLPLSLDLLLHHDPLELFRGGSDHVPITTIFDSIEWLAG